MLAHKLPRYGTGNNPKLSLFRLTASEGGTGDGSRQGLQYDAMFGHVANRHCPLIENTLKDKKIRLFRKLMLREHEDKLLRKYDFDYAVGEDWEADAARTTKNRITDEIEIRLTRFMGDEKRTRLENLIRCYVGYLEKKRMRVECHQRSVLLEVVVFLMNAYLPEYRDECVHMFSYLLGLQAEPARAIERVLERHGKKFAAYAIPRRAGKSFNICLLIALILVCLPGENVAYLCDKVALQKKMNADIQEMINEIYPLAFELVKRSSPPLVRSNESCILVQWRDAKPCRLEIICLHNSQVSPL